MSNDSDHPVPKTEPSTGNLASNEGHGVEGDQPSASSTSDKGLSKNQLKKRKRWQKHIELKKRRKEQERGKCPRLCVSLLRTALTPLLHWHECNRNSSEVKRHKAKRYEMSQARRSRPLVFTLPNMAIEMIF